MSEEEFTVCCTEKLANTFCPHVAGKDNGRWSKKPTYRICEQKLI